MDGERKINLCEGVPLNSTGAAANIFLNTGRSKLNPDGTVIQLKTEKPADVGVHINTTFSIASSKKIKVLFVLNFLLSVICMVISCSIAFYYWNEMISMRRQLDSMKDHFIAHNNQDKFESSPLVAEKRHIFKGIDLREPRMDSEPRLQVSANARKYYVEDLGEDMLLVDSSKKNPSTDKSPVFELPILQKDPLIAHFNGGIRETNIQGNMILGPWVRDKEVSSKGSEAKIELNDKYVTIKESGLYLIYAQVVYLTHAPNCFFIWAQQPSPATPRLLSTCATGDDSSTRPLDKAQISCSVQTVARLYKDDVVNIAQREPNRTLWLRPGYSYFGFVKLSS